MILLYTNIKLGLMSMTNLATILFTSHMLEYTNKSVDNHVNLALAFYFATTQTNQMSISEKHHYVMNTVSNSNFDATKQHPCEFVSDKSACLIDFDIALKNMQ